jgi:hypothetical protein
MTAQHSFAISDPKAASRRPIAVHYNFAAGQLSKRAINSTGQLGRLIGLASEVDLRHCSFTVNRDRWRNWRSGATPKVRQFAEVRGVEVKLTSIKAAERSGWARVTLDPKVSPDFRLDGKVLLGADRVRVTPSGIYCKKPVFR